MNQTHISPLGLCVDLWFVYEEYHDPCTYKKCQGQGYGVQRHFQQYFSYIVACSFIGGGNRRKPPACRKSLTNFITYCCIEYALPRAGFEVTTLVAIGIDCICSCKSNYHTITTTTAGPLPIYSNYQQLRLINSVSVVGVSFQWKAVFSDPIHYVLSFMRQFQFPIWFIPCAPFFTYMINNFCKLVLVPFNLRVVIPDRLEGLAVPVPQ